MFYNFFGLDFKTALTMHIYIIHTILQLLMRGIFISLDFQLKTEQYKHRINKQLFKTR